MNDPRLSPTQRRPAHDLKIAVGRLLDLVETDGARRKAALILRDIILRHAQAKKGGKP